MNRWFAIAKGTEVPRRHVGHHRLLGQELAVWRSDSGAINAWENRCPHRGVRLTLGTCEGEELRCQYHAWRFSSLSGQCTLIPAHPSQKPASTVHARTFAVAERDGLIWVNLAQEPSPQAPAGVAQAVEYTRSIFVDAGLNIVREILLQGYPLGTGPASANVWSKDDYCLQAGITDRDPFLTFLLQPASDLQTVIHGVLHTPVDPALRLSRLRHHSSAMNAVRDRAEHRVATGVLS